MKRLLIAALFIALALGAQAATVTSGTLTVTTEAPPLAQGLICVTLDWASDSGGNCVATVTEVEGVVYRVSVNPDDGATSPTNNYDVTLTDRDGADILVAQGANLSSTTTLNRCPLIGDGATTSMPISTIGGLTFAVANAGDTRGGIIRIFLKR